MFWFSKVHFLTCQKVYDYTNDDFTLTKGKQTLGHWDVWVGWALRRRASDLNSDEPLDCGSEQLAFSFKALVRLLGVNSGTANGFGND